MGPEAPGVVHFLEVREFMQHQVVAHEGRGLHQAPIERDSAAAGAGTPAGALVTHRDPLHRQLVWRRQLKDARRQFLRRQLAQMPLDHRPEVLGRTRDAHGFTAETDQSGVLVVAGLQPDPFTAEVDFRSERPGCRPRGSKGLPQELPLQPDHVLFGEPPGFGNRSASRNGHAGRTVRAQAQDVTPRSPVANKAESHAPGASDQPVFLCWRGSSGAKEPLELHAMI